MKASPLNQVKEQFGTKAELVSAIEGLATEELWLDRVNEDKGLARVSNQKLLHLHKVLTEVKEGFGSRNALIAKICELEDRKDEGYQTRLGRWPTPRLWDHYRAVNAKAKAN